MGFDLQRIDQSSFWLAQNLRLNFYSQCAKILQNSAKAHLFSPLFALGEGILQTTEITAAIAEAVFKASINIFGQLFSDSYNGQLGGIQLVEALFLGVCAVPFVLLRLANVAIQFFLSPSNYLENEISELPQRGNAQQNLLQH